MNKLEQAAQNLLDYFDIDDCGILFDSHMEALREALAEQEEQEPVGHVLSDGTICWDKWCPDAGTLLYAAPQPVKQEPVAEIIGFERTNDIRGVKRIPRIKWNVPLWEDESPLQLGNLYAAPVRTKDLSDDEIEKAFWGNGDTEIEGCRAVIAAYKEKNK